MQPKSTLPNRISCNLYQPPPGMELILGEVTKDLSRQREVLARTAWTEKTVEGLGQMVYTQQQQLTHLSELMQSQNQETLKMAQWIYRSYEGTRTLTEFVVGTRTKTGRTAEGPGTLPVGGWQKSNPNRKGVEPSPVTTQ